MWNAKDGKPTMQLLQTIKHKSQVTVMEHWVEIRTCQYHDGEKTPCEVCENARYDYEVEMGNRSWAE